MRAGSAPTRRCGPARPPRSAIPTCLSWSARSWSPRHLPGRVIARSGLGSVVSTACRSAASGCCGCSARKDSWLRSGSEAAASRVPMTARRAEGWTSRPSRPKMHVQLSNHHRPSVRRVGGPARSRPGVSIQSKDGGGGPWGCIACTVNGCDARPRSSLACSSTTSG